MMGASGDESMSENENTETKSMERTCPNCQHFYEHGKTEWEDSPKCENCSHRGGFDDNWKAKPQEADQQKA